MSDGGRSDQGRVRSAVCSHSLIADPQAKLALAKSRASPPQARAVQPASEPNWRWPRRGRPDVGTSVAASLRDHLRFHPRHPPRLRISLRALTSIPNACVLVPSVGFRGVAPTEPDGVHPGAGFFPSTGTRRGNCGCIRCVHTCLTKFG